MNPHRCGCATYAQTASGVAADCFARVIPAQLHCPLKPAPLTVRVTTFPVDSQRRFEVGQRLIANLFVASGVPAVVICGLKLVENCAPVLDTLHRMEVLDLFTLDGAGVITHSEGPFTASSCAVSNFLSIPCRRVP